MRRPFICLVPALVMFGLLAGCGQPARLARECPDLRGNFAVSPGQDSTGQFDLLSTYLSGGVQHAAGAPWRSLVIEGDSKRSLQLTFVRPAGREARRPDTQVPAYIQRALETTYNQPLERQTRTLERGRDYDCKLGWLTPVGGGEGARIRRNADGDLEGELSVRRARVFSLWAETGAGIPYWFDTETRYSRWVSVGSADIGQPVAPATLTGVARQEHEQTYGKAPAPGGAPAANSSAATGARYDVQQAVRAHVDRNAELMSLREEGGRYVLTLRVQSQGPVTRTLENLAGDAWLHEVQDHGSIDGGKVNSDRTEIATMSFRVGAPR